MFATSANGNRDTQLCRIVPKLQENYASPFVLNADIAEGSLGDYTAHIIATPFNDSDLVATVACLDGTRILNSFGRGFGRGSIEVEIFCGKVDDKESEGVAIAYRIFEKYRVSNNDQGLAVTGKGGNFMLFPDQFQVTSFNASRGTVMVSLTGYAYTQAGAKQI